MLPIASAESEYISSNCAAVSRIDDGEDEIRPLIHQPADEQRRDHEQRGRRTRRIRRARGRRAENRTAIACQARVKPNSRRW